jgi:demethylmenaquinone methyltransferase/2-methoxy-6-polyprenyl-1,4-benzoquinol methylase
MSTIESRAPAKGTRPPGADNEAEASRKVREMFTDIAPRYDLLNHLLSMQLDRLWRARVAKHFRSLLSRPETTVLDLCCGTGDLAFALGGSAKARIFGVDFSHSMLVRARQKGVKGNSPQNGRGSAIEFLEGDALRLPFADASFDLVTTAFGFRNLANYEAGLREIMRVLKVGGLIAILEFTEPPEGVIGDIYRWYFRNVLPRIGGLISGDRSAYTYLPASVSRFFRPQELASLMEQVGYDTPTFHAWTFGTVALHTGIRRQ